jgi:hypothetical protein
LLTVLKSYPRMNIMADGGYRDFLAGANVKRRKIVGRVG